MSKQMDAINMLAETMYAPMPGEYNRLDLENGVTAEFAAELLLADEKAKRTVKLYIERGDIRGPMVVETVDARVGQLHVTLRLVRGATPEDVIEYAERMRAEAKLPVTPMTVAAQTARLVNGGAA
jgi:hypothetical protein